MTTGKVKWFNFKKGYGFIVPSDDSGDLFVHFSVIVAEEGKFKTLNQDDEVEFEIIQGEKGREAREVHVIKAAPRNRRKKSFRKQKPGTEPNITPEV